MSRWVDRVDCQSKKLGCVWPILKPHLLFEASKCTWKCFVFLQKKAQDFIKDDTGDHFIGLLEHHQNEIEVYCERT